MIRNRLIAAAVAATLLTAAGSIADGVNGVKVVKNEITVRP